MPIFRLSGAWRKDTGVVRAPVSEQPIVAPSERDAVAIALMRLSDLLVERTNLACLTGPDRQFTWTLRMDRSTRVVI